MEQVNGRDNLKYIWKCNQALLRFADQALDAFAAKAKDFDPTEIEAAEKIGFRGRLKTKTVWAYPFASLKEGRFAYTLTQDKQKKFGDTIRPITDFSPVGYVDLSGFTYLQCKYSNEQNDEERFVFIQVDRETAISFLFRELSLPLKEDPRSLPEETDQKLAAAEEKIRASLAMQERSKTP